MRLLRNILPPVVVFIAFAAVAELCIRAFAVPSYTFPAPSAVFAAMYQKRADLAQSLLSTAEAALIGFAMSALIGVILAVLLSTSRLVQRAFYPYTVFFQTVPIVAIAPLLVIWFDFGWKSVAVSAFIASVFPVIANTLTGLLSVDPALRDLFKLYGASRTATLWKLKLPGALPNIFTGLRIAAGLAVIGAIVGEFVAGVLTRGAGLGVAVLVAKRLGNTADIFAAVLAASLLGLVMLASINLVGYLALRRWHASEQSREWEMNLKQTMILMLMTMLTCGVAYAGDKVKLSLNWVPEPEFGGIYAARDTGAFPRRGLDVEIQPGGAGTPTWQLVATGKTDFAVASADEVIIARSQGADIVAIYAIYQTCPQGIMVHQSRGLKTIADLFNTGGKLAVEPGLAYVNYLKNKFGFDKMRLVAYDGGIGNFLNDPSFAQQCFVTSEPLAAKKQGSDPQVFLVADAGYNPYTAVIIAKRDKVRDNPKQVEAIAAGLRDGWRAYLDDPKPTNDTMSKLNPDMGADTMQAAADAQKPLIETAETKTGELGMMTLDRWRQLVDQLVELKLVEKAKAPTANSCFVGTISK